MKRYCWHIIVPFLLSVSLYSFAYSCPAEKNPIMIAVTKVSPNYLRWLKKADSTLLVINMFDLRTDSALLKLGNCSGLLITGGEDIDPKLYGKPDQKKDCQEIDSHRDSLEIVLIEKALSLKMPILGICRGEQILNVALGGTLIVDIPKYFTKEQIDKEQVRENSHVNVTHQCKDYLHCFHPVKVVPNTLLISIIKDDTGSVTSNHHQAIETLAPGIRCNVRSEDGLTEGIEWENPENKSFLIGVQWHPERMDVRNAFSGNLVCEFLYKVLKYNESQKKKK